jgi:hypothetical protein
MSVEIYMLEKIITPCNMVNVYACLSSIIPINKAPFNQKKKKESQ